MDDDSLELRFKAIKDDIESLEWRLRKIMKEDTNMVLGVVNDRANELRAEMRAMGDELRTELRTEMNLLLTNALAATFAEFMQALKNQTETLLAANTEIRRELRRDLDERDVSTGTRIGRVEDRTNALDGRTDALEGRMSAVEHRLDERSA